ncbi:Ammonium transporter 3 member 1 [Senna tora]|uniref:Ammonium transporter 3 member 1 n=1 Tax=Senna tora TaxID=362788 RepID=A0A834SPH6_9FABA|nr:Ammonium transporter 3 member 1 [Senna tora]
MVALGKFPAKAWRNRNFSSNATFGRPMNGTILSPKLIEYPHPTQQNSPPESPPSAATRCPPCSSIPGFPPPFPTSVAKNHERAIYYIVLPTRGRADCGVGRIGNLDRQAESIRIACPFSGRRIPRDESLKPLESPPILLYFKNLRYGDHRQFY